jgi:hypothetical protein
MKGTTVAGSAVCRRQNTYSAHTVMAEFPD